MYFLYYLATTGFGVAAIFREHTPKRYKKAKQKMD
jgi:hypothetical protein